MDYKLVKHRKIQGHTRHIELLVNAEVEAGYLAVIAEYEQATAEYQAVLVAYREELVAWQALPAAERGPRPVAPEGPPMKPEDPRIYESFDWGMDVPLATVRRETKLLLDAKYQVLEEVLPGEDQDF